MSWLLLAPVAVGLLILVPLVVYLPRRTRARVTELRTRLDADLRLMTGCGVVSGWNRVPGVLALTSDRLICEPAMGLAGRAEIRLADILGVSWEDAERTRHRRARKYRGKRILGVATASGVTHVYALARDRAGAWESALPARTA